MKWPVWSQKKADPEFVQIGDREGQQEKNKKQKFFTSHGQAEIWHSVE